MTATYDSSAIEVLTGLEPVRKRPGMYTLTERPNHLAQEVIDNSADEAIAGFADEIAVTLAPGDLLFFCSDGVAEAGDPRTFGEARVKEIVREHRKQSADAIADAVFAAARACCGTPRDDMSLLVIKASEVKAAPGGAQKGRRAARSPDVP